MKKLLVALFAIALSLSAMSQITFEPIEVPGTFSATFTEAGGDYGAKLYSFTLAAPQVLLFSSDHSQENLYFELFEDADLQNSINFGPSILTPELPAGNYWFAVYCNPAMLPFTAQITVAVLNSYYYDLDYSTPITPAVPVHMEKADLTSGILFDDLFAGDVAGFKFAAEANQMYKIKMDLDYTENIGYLIAGVMLLHENLTQDITEDAERFFMMDLLSHANHFSTQFYYEAPAGEELKIAAGHFMNTVNGELLYTVEITEAEFTHTDAPYAAPSVVDMTLPFLSHLYFSPQYNTYVSGYDDYIYTKVFRLTLAEETVLYYESFGEMWSGTPFSIFADESLEELVAYSVWQGDRRTLPAGTYYIVFTDEHYYADFGEYLDFTASIVAEEPAYTAITLPELMDAAPEIQYSELPFAIAGIFADGLTSIVQGHEELHFGEPHENYYAIACKINLTAGQVLKIHEHSEEDAYLYMYKKVNGNYEYVTDNDDHETGNPEWSDLDSYIEANPINETGEYYCVASTYSQAGSAPEEFYLTIYTNDEPPVPELELTEIVATTPNVTALQVSIGVTAAQLKAALKTLTLTATTENDNSFAIYNSPLGWTFNADNTEARYTNFTIAGYELAANYQPATVALSYSGIAEVEASQLKLYPNPVAEQITVSGMQGGELITILDLNGRVLSRSVGANSTQTFNAGHLSKGIYLLTVQSKGQMRVMKFVKE